MLKIKKHLEIFKIALICALKNYKALIALSIFLMTCLVIFANLWKSISIQQGLEGFNSEQLLWYIAFNQWVLVSIPSTHDNMEQDLRSGRLVYLLPRPISYLGSIFSEAVGTLTGNLIILGFVSFLFTWSQADSLPFHFTGLIITVILGFAAGLIAIIFQMLIGLSAFWLNEAAPFYWVWEKLLFMFGGLMLPLSTYPPWMQTFASFTPFPQILGYRSVLALEFNFYEFFTLILSMLLWGIIGIILLRVVYYKGLRILNVGGG